jgi:predicted transcriptional regulator
MKLGRPREVEDPVRVSVRVEACDYDRLDRFARESGTSVPAMIRQAISALQTRPQAQTSAQ